MPQSRSRSRSRNKWWDIPKSTQYVIVAALAVVAVLCVGYLMHTGGKSAPEAAPSGATASSADLSGPKNVLLIGDSYAAGNGASRAADTSWAALLASKMGWLLTNDARGGTGYSIALTGSAAKAGCGLATCPNFDQMLRSASATLAPDIVFISGGRNDAAVPASREAAAVQQVFRDARRLFPRAKIIATTPVWDDDPAPAQLSAIQRDVATNLRLVKGTLLGIGEPLRGHRDLVVADGIHPNDKGHAAIERAVYRALVKARLAS